MFVASSLTFVALHTYASSRLHVTQAAHEGDAEKAKKRNDPQEAEKKEKRRREQQEAEKGDEEARRRKKQEEGEERKQVGYCCAGTV